MKLTFMHWISKFLEVFLIDHKILLGSNILAYTNSRTCMRKDFRLSSEELTFKLYDVANDGLVDTIVEK